MLRLGQITVFGELITDAFGMLGHNSFHRLLLMLVFLLVSGVAAHAIATGDV